MDQASYQLFKEATTMMKNDDPECIPLFEQIDTYNARAHLAVIYTDGKCGEPVDYDRALQYTADNPNPLAKAIEAKIRCILRKEDVDCTKYLEELTYQHETYPNNVTVTIVLAEMYLNGRGAEVNYEAACNVNPHLKNRKTLLWELSQMDADTRDNLEKHLASKEETKDVAELVRTYGLNSPRKGPSERNNALRTRTQQTIDDALRNKAPKEDIRNLCVNWFKNDPCIKSAYYYMRNVYDADEDLTKHAIDILETAEVNLKYLKTVVHYYYRNEQWDDLRRNLEKDEERNLDFYRAMLYLHDDDKENCAKYLVSYLKKTDSSSSNQPIQAMRLLLKLKPEWVMYHLDYAKTILNETNALHRFIAAFALYKYGDPINKKKAIEVLKDDSKILFEAAELMYSETGDSLYKERMDKLSFNVASEPGYIFSYKDDTETVLSHYHELSPKWRLSALDELVYRFIKGKQGTEKDYNKAAELLEEKIELCEEFNISTLKDKGSLGILMFNGKIPCHDENLMFRYLYDMRDALPYRNMVISCLLEGRGTERDVEDAISLIRANNITSQWGILLEICNENPDDEQMSKVKTQIICEILNKGQINQSILDEMKSLEEEDIPSDIEMTCRDYTYSKITKLMTEADRATDPVYKLRCLDFARRLGDIKACNKEAMLLKEHFNKPKLSYSILRDSGMDASNVYVRKIGPKDQVLVNIDENMKKIIKPAD